MKTIATMPRQWLHIILNHDEWERMRPMVKKTAADYNVSGYGRNLYLEVYVSETEANQIETALEAL